MNLVWSHLHASECNKDSRRSYSPLAIPRGVNGAALTACEEIDEALPDTDRAAGVKEGESTFKAFLKLPENMLVEDIARLLQTLSLVSRRCWVVKLPGVFSPELFLMIGE